jgi:hypothetical protein
MEDPVTTNEFYYLLLVLGSFGAFAVGLLVASFQYQAWQRRPEVARAPLQSKAAPRRSR